MLTGARFQWRRSVLLFLAVALGFIAWRWPGDLVWDDSPNVCANLYSPGSPLYTFADPDFFRAIGRDVFGDLHADGYRPLNWTVRRLGLACLVANSARATFGFLILNGLMLGALAVTYFQFARRFTATDAGALLAVFLLVCSTPLLTGSLVLFTGIQALVPLMMCGALNCYYAALESRRPGGWMLLLGLILFVGPWYREFVGLTSLLIVLYEGLRVRCRSGIALLAGMCFLHALFPTALLHVLCCPRLPVLPVHQLGALGEGMGQGVAAQAGLLASVKSVVKSLKWRIFLDLVSVLPPLLFVLSAIPWVKAIRRLTPPPIPWSHAGRLSLFFALTFFPFLKVFKEQVHLLYCLVPASVLLAVSIEWFWKTQDPALTDREPRNAKPRWRTAGRVVFLALLAVALADQAMNLLVVRGVTRQCYAAIARLSAFCNREMPPGSILISNAHHAHDVRLYSLGRFECYDTAVTSGRKPLFLGDVTALHDFLKRQAGRDVYCLDARLPVTKDQLGFDRVHWIVRDRPIELESYGEIDRVSYRYPVLDPLKLLLPTRNMTWPGSPDLEFDYYRGPALDGSFGLREVAVRYEFYKVASRTVHPPPTNGPPSR